MVSIRINQSVEYVPIIAESALIWKALGNYSIKTLMKFVDLRKSDCSN